MERSRIEELHYITDWRNISSILRHGIVSHRRARSIAHVTVADPAVQARREAVTVPGGQPLHQYACLYVHARNVMLYGLLRKGLDRLAVLVVDPGVLDLEGVVVTDRNAASGAAIFRGAAEGVEALDESLVYAEWWSADRDARQQRCAEVLVPGRIAPTHVRAVHVAETTAVDRMRGDLPGLAVPVIVDEWLFYRGGAP